MSELYKKAKVQFGEKLPFVIYCKPNSNDVIALFQKNDALFNLDEKNDSGFAIVSFDNALRYLIPDKYCDIYFEKKDSSNLILSKEINYEIQVSDKIFFEKNVTKAVQAIIRNEFEKVVLSRRESIELSYFDFELSFRKLLQNYESAFNYCFYHPKVGMWLGASPEQFLKIEDSNFKTVSLAGTTVTNENIVWSEKEKNEQQIVTDYIIENLKKYSSNIIVSNPYTFKAGNLSHIKTDIEAQNITTENSKELINSLHPTPAVCGFPKNNAKKFIDEHEGYYRAFYAGYMGEWKKNMKTHKMHQSDLFVNLRCMRIDKLTAEIYTGCGITKDSNPEKEFIETVNKSKTIKKVL